MCSDASFPCLRLHECKYHEIKIWNIHLITQQNIYQRVDEPTDIYIVNFNSGEVIELQAEIVFSQHHINAFETPDGSEIIMDISPSDDFGLR